jgi:tetratricopeptide (TPR) repeat protein
MKSQPQGKRQSKESRLAQSLSLTVVFIQNKEDQSPEFIKEILAKTKDETGKSFEWIWMRGEDLSAPAEADSRLKIINVPAGAEKNYLSPLIEAISQDWVLLLPISQLTQSLSLTQLVSLKSERLDPKTKYYLQFSDDPKSKHSNGPSFVLFHKDFFSYFSETLSLGFEHIWSELNYFCKKIAIAEEIILINQPDPIDKTTISGFRPGALSKYKLWKNWFIHLPLTESRNKSSIASNWLSESSLNRLIFILSALVLFITIPLLGLKSGISGDEPGFQYPQALKIYEYYHSLGRDTSYKASMPEFQAYGMSFDVITVFVIKVFKIENIYEARHVMNSMVGWLAILFAALIAVRLAGYRAGIIVLFLLFISPHWLGHCYNNPKDIPFAAAYIFTIYFIIRLLKEMPRPDKSTYAMIALGIAMALSVRAGGLILIPYYVLFVGLYFLLSTPGTGIFSKENLQRFESYALSTIVVCLFGYFCGLLLWPYALQNPISNPISSMKILTNYAVTLRQVFDGKILWSDHMPWYYLSKYIFITTPLIVITGIILFLLLFSFRKGQKYDYYWYFILAFSIIFPLFYIYYKQSNVYDGWRHVLFVYPSIAILAGLGIHFLLDAFRKKRIVVFSILGLFLLMSFMPLKHIIKNHPHEYVYYNELIGGVDNAVGKFETDYYYHSIRAGSLWLKNKILNDPKLRDHKIIVATNFSPGVSYYFRDVRDSIKIIYLRYYDRGEYDWDYDIIANSYINSFQLKNKHWPPLNTIHTVNVDNTPICAIIERKNKDDFYGTNELNSKKYDLALPALQRAVEFDPGNESALLNLAKGYLETGKIDDAIRILNKCLKVYPDYDKALNLLGICYLNKNDHPTAISIFLRIIKVNPKYVSAYYNLGYMYKLENNLQLSVNYLKQAIIVNKNYKPSYYLLADILKSAGRNDEAQQILQMAKEP